MHEKKKQKKFNLISNHSVLYLNSLIYIINQPTTFNKKQNIDTREEENRPLRPASQRRGRQGPTNQQLSCKTAQLAPQGPRTQECHKRSMCDRRIPCSLCTIQNRRSSRSPRRPVISCRALSLCCLVRLYGFAL